MIPSSRGDSIAGEVLPLSDCTVDSAGAGGSVDAAAVDFAWLSSCCLLSFQVGSQD